MTRRRSASGLMIEVIYVADDCSGPGDSRPLPAMRAQVPVMPGTVKLMCTACFGKTKVEFYVEDGPHGSRTFKMDVKPDSWWR